MQHKILHQSAESKMSNKFTIYRNAGKTDLIKRKERGTITYADP